MIQTQNRNQQDDHGFVHVGRTLNYAAREISCALDAYISTRVSPELTGMRGMVLGFLMQETESGKQIYQRDLEARFHTNRSSITTMLQLLALNPACVCEISVIFFVFRHTPKCSAMLWLKKFRRCPRAAKQEIPYV